MKKYTDRKTTPLIFHHIVHYVWLPLNTLLTLYLLVQSYANGTLNKSISYVIVGAMMLIYILLLAGAFIGFFRWKKYAWRFMLITSCGQLLIILLMVASFSTIQSQMMDMVLAIVSPFVVMDLLILLYYGKRKAIFNDDMPLKDVQQGAWEVTSAQETTGDVAETLTDEEFAVAETWGITSLPKRIRVKHNTMHLDGAAVPRNWSYTFTGSIVLRDQIVACSQKHWEFDYTDALANPKTGGLFAAMVRHHVDVTTAYELIQAMPEDVQPLDGPAAGTVSENVQKIQRQITNCIMQYPNFEYTQELEHPETGELFAEMVRYGVEIKAAYQTVLKMRKSMLYSRRPARTGLG